MTGNLNFLDEPRDEKGRWTTGGGITQWHKSANGMVRLAAATSTPFDSRKLPNERTDWMSAQTGPSSGRSVISRRI
jgi:hypothetical protein